MNRFLLFFSCILMLNFAWAQPQPTPTETLVGTLQKIETEAQRRGISPDNTPNLLVEIPEFNALSERSNAVWSTALDNLSLVAPTWNKRCILTSSFGGLTPENYLMFLVRALDMYDKKQFEKDDIQLALTPFGHLNGLLSDNYRDSRVRNILTRARALLADDPNVAKGIDSVLSGEAKKSLDEMRASLAGTSQHAPPKIELKGEEKLPAQVAGHETEAVTNSPPNPLVANSSVPSSEKSFQDHSSSHWWLAVSVIAIVGLALILGNRRK